MCVLRTINYLHLCKYVLYKVKKVTSTGISAGVEGANSTAMEFEYLCHCA